MAASSEFRLDVEGAEEAEEAIRALEAVRRKIEIARDDAATLAQRTVPTARDLVSLEAFALLAQKADGGPGSFTSAMEAGLEHVDHLIDQMRADIIRQRNIDDAAARDLSNRA